MPEGRGGTDEVRAVATEAWPGHGWKAFRMLEEGARALMVPSRSPSCAQRLRRMVRANTLPHESYNAISPELMHEVL